MSPEQKNLDPAAVASTPVSSVGASEARESQVREDAAALKQRWQALSAKVEGPAGEAACAALLRDLAVRDPEEAIRLASLETNWRRRGIFLRAALRGWATVAPDAAAKWTLANLREGERRTAVEELIAGAMVHPAGAIRAIAWLCAEDPRMASDHGNTLILELTRAGEFEAAARFATAAPAECRNFWLGSAFFHWAQHQPDKALAALNEIPDTGGRLEALQSAVSGWAASDPAALVNFAGGMTAGEARTAALREGLQQWVTADPVAAVKWMEKLEPGEAFDGGAEAVATVAELVAKKPEVAVAWARSIGNPERRSSTLAEVVRQWASHDPVAARRYAAASDDLQPGDRANLLSDFESPKSE